MEAFFIRHGIVIDLTAVGSTQTDHSPALFPINEDNKETPVPNRSQSNDSQLSVIGSIIDLCQCCIPVQLISSTQRAALRAEISSVLCLVENHMNAFRSYAKTRRQARDRRLPWEGPHCP